MFTKLNTPYRNALFVDTGVLVYSFKYRPTWRIQLRDLTGTNLSIVYRTFAYQPIL